MSGPIWSLDGVPRCPGVYLFRDAQGQVLYVGKARDLRARLANYRRPGGEGRLNILFLEQDARSVETIVTRTDTHTGRCLGELFDAEDRSTLEPQATTSD